MKSIIIAASVITLASVSSAGSARAADSEQQSAAGEIVVTAQRRSERLQDVPMSITALSADMLAKAGITNTSDIARVSPGVTMPFYGAFLQPAIRGVSSTGANIGDNSNVAMYLDGVYQPQQIASLIDLPDVEQIEVLKGPQGALYGQNATGGAILVTTSAPSFTPTGKLSLGYGNHNAFVARGAVTGPVVDGVAYSLSGGYQDRDGFRRNVVTGEHDKGLTSKVVRGKLLVEPSNAVKFTATGYYADRTDSAMYAAVALANNSAGYAFVPTAPKPTSAKDFSSSPDVFTRIRSWGVSGHGEVTIEGAGTLNSVTSYAKNKITYLSDIDASAVNYAEAYALINAHYFVQEAYFASDQFGPLSFLVGGLYIQGAETFNRNGFRLGTNTPSVVPAPGQYASVTESFGRLKKEIFAGYAEATLKATDELVFTAGARYTRERQRGFSNAASFGFGPVTEYPGGRVTFSKFTPRLTARYEILPNANIYASWGKGFKSGIINTGNLAQEPVNPEVITAYEVGFKGRIADGLSVNVAGFYYDYKDLQVVVYIPPDYIQQNAASARIKGLEGDVTWSVTPRLTLSGGASVLDAKYRRFPGAQVFMPTGFGNALGIGDLSGRRMLRSPKFSGNIAATYTVETGAGKFQAHGSLYHNSGFGFEVTNRLRQVAFTTADAELSFEPAGLENVRLVLWGKNLGDKAYLASVLASQIADVGSYAEPRTFGVRGEFKY